MVILRLSSSKTQKQNTSVHLKTLWYWGTWMLKSQSQVHAHLPCCNTHFMNTVNNVIYLTFGIVYLSTITQNDWVHFRTGEPWQYSFQHYTFSRVQKWIPIFWYLLHAHPWLCFMFPLHILETTRKRLCEKMKTFRAV
jgi:hypothetical protein